MVFYDCSHKCSGESTSYAVNYFYYVLVDDNLILFDQSK